MTNGIKVVRRFDVHSTRRRKDQTNFQVAVRIPRVSRLMALAIRFDHLIQQGVVSDQAELSRIGQVSRARITQIMNLLNLAPDIQEQLVLGTENCVGRDAVTERTLRSVLAENNWQTQRRLWCQRTR